MENSPVQTKARFVVRYILGTAVGWILALLSIFPALGIWEIFTSITWQYFREEVWHEVGSNWLVRAFTLLLIIATFLLMGASVGFAQWKIALKERISKRVWILSCTFTVATGVIGLLAASYVTLPMISVHQGIYSGLDTRLTLNNSWAVTVAVMGGGCGFATGLPQWFVLRRYFYNASSWLIILTMGGIALFAAFAAVVFVVRNAVLSWTLGCIACPIAFGGVTGIALYGLLKRSKTSLP